MVAFNSADILKQLHWRYATKKFDAHKKISTEHWATLEEVLQLAPSSYGLQPFQFLVVQNPEIRKKLTQASYGQAQIETCSHLVVLTALKTLSAENIKNYMKLISETRNIPLESLQGYKQMMEGSLLKNPNFSASTWAAKQTYLVMGSFMTVASLLNIDVCPMEGFDPVQYEDILSLKNSNHTPTLVMAVGYRAEDDAYQKMKKVRQDKSQLIRIIS